MKSITLKIAVLFILPLTFSSCYKKQDTIVVVSVVNVEGAHISNARVIIYGSGTLGDIAIRDTTYTNSEGEAIFNFNETYQSGQGGVAVLDIEASKDGLSSQGIIKVNQETTSNETIILN